MNKIILLFILLKLSLAQNLYFSDILECNYKFDSNYNSKMILTIDNHKYRETITYPNMETFFALPVDRNNYNISYYHDNIYINSQINYKYTEGLIVDYKPTYNDILIKNNKVSLFNNNYYYDKNHILNVHLLITLKPLDLNQANLNLEMYFNNELIKNNILTSYNNGISYKLELEGKPGFNKINIDATTTGIWCSCPSIGDGYNNNKYILLWITDINDDIINNTIISNKIKLNITDYHQFVSIYK